MNIENITLAVYSVAIIGFALSYAIVLGHLLARPIKALASLLF